MKLYTLTLTGLLALSLTVPSAFAGESPSATPAANAAEIKIIHDWPGYTGPEGTFADQSRVKLLDDLSQARLVWTSEHDDLGYGKTTSGGGHRYGAQSRPSGSCSLIVAGGLVIVTYFNPRNSVVADDVVLALDAATGKTRWKQVYAGKGLNRSAGKHPSYGPTPAAADGRVFHLGSAGRIYALELAGGKPLWEADLGDYPQHYQALAATMQPKDEIKDGMWSIRKTGGGMRQTVNPLIVIDGVLMVPSYLPRLYAYDAATGKELWKLDGVLRAPSPVTLNGRTYAFCTGGGQMRLVEPKTGKVLWSEKNNVSLPTTHGFVVADGRAFVPYAPGEAKTGPLAAFALSETGAKLLWQSKDEVNTETYFAYRDGVIYANVPDKYVKAFKADDGTVLSDLNVENSMSLHGHLHLWGDRLVLVGDDCHESLGHVCYYQSCTPGPKDLKLSGKPLAPRTFRSYVGVGGYECWMRPPFADGFLFNRSVDTQTGKGVILCWDLRQPKGN
jgi:outer membrane protein assembly factor BamB